MNEPEYALMYEAEDTHWWYVSLHDLVLRFVPAGKTLQIFDAGCGTGRLLQLLSARGNAQGCDASETAVRSCRKRGLATAVQADLNTTVLDRDRYDVITLIDVLYHANIGDERAVLKKIHAALRPGGRLIIQVPAYEWLRSDHDRAVHTRRRYQQADIVGMLHDIDFVVEKATYRVSFLLLPIVMVRMGQRLFRRKRTKTPASDVDPSPKVLNGFLRTIMRMENLLLRRLDLPCGSSIFAVARRPCLVRQGARNKKERE
jgi:2-polyprenyl-3-methyl-5-hydroxy-6-metoxy-1,4-benzoquinol methylase